MKKEYNLPEKNPENSIVHEPAVSYSKYVAKEKELSPILTEEEKNKLLTTEQIKENLHQHIHKLFNP